MLLYDRVREAAVRLGAQAARDLPGTAVYDVSDVVPLFSDWKREESREVPRMPPHNKLWVEWRDSGREGGVSASCIAGAWIFYVSREAFKQTNWSFDNLGFDVSSADNHCLCIPFGYYHSHSSAPHVVGRPFVYPFLVGVVGWDGFRRSRIIKGPAKCAEDASGTFGVPALGDEEGVACHSMVWPAFMAFALLHCKNVVTQDHAPEPRIQRECAKHGRPPRVTYKTLRLEVPASAVRRQSYGGDADDGPKVRFHLCSGHFKNLQHERYRSKGWHWWPAFWRGDPKLGTVNKDYKLVPKSS